MRNEKLVQFHSSHLLADIHIRPLGKIRQVVLRFITGSYLGSEIETVEEIDDPELSEQIVIESYSTPSEAFNRLAELIKQFDLVIITTPSFWRSPYDGGNSGD